jgi:hypothetical protein
MTPPDAHPSPPVLARFYTELLSLWWGGVFFATSVQLCSVKVTVQGVQTIARLGWDTILGVKESKVDEASIAPVVVD